MTQQSGIKVVQLFQKEDFQGESSAKRRRRPSGQYKLIEDVYQEATIISRHACRLT